MEFLIKLNPEFLSQTLEEAKATFALSSFVLTRQKMTITVSFRQKSYVLTASRTVGAAAVCKMKLGSQNHFL